jgi:hypothetical protein
VMYGATAGFFYVAFTIPANKDPNIGEYVSLSVWIFFVAGASRLLSIRWPSKVRQASPALLAAVAIYVLLVYAVGEIGVANWPGNERNSNAQLRAVTAELAEELGRHISTNDCLTYAPGPGWPASLEYLMMASSGRSPVNTPIDVDPTTTTIDEYIGTAKQCKAIIVYREDIAQVAKVFYAPAVRQPYLRALAQWVQRSDSGYALDRTWTFTDLAPTSQHTLGHYDGVSLTVELYFRAAPA